jgi:hypothetical protein
MSEGGSDSPRYLTPPDLNACGDRVLVSMEDKTIGMHITHMRAQARTCACSLSLSSSLPPSKTIGMHITKMHAHARAHTHINQANVHARELALSPSLPSANPSLTLSSLPTSQPTLAPTPLSPFLSTTRNGLRPTQALLSRTKRTTGSPGSRRLAACCGGKGSASSYHHSTTCALILVRGLTAVLHLHSAT